MPTATVSLAAIRRLSVSTQAYAPRFRRARRAERDLGTGKTAGGQRSREWDGVIGIIDHDDGNDARLSQALQRLVRRRKCVGHVSAISVRCASSAATTPWRRILIR